MSTMPRAYHLLNKNLEFCGDLPIMGHNISFDKNFLAGKDIHIPGALLDTMPLLIWPSKKLAASLSKFYQDFQYRKPTIALRHRRCQGQHRIISNYLRQAQSIPQQNDLLLQALQNNQNPDCKIYHQLLEHCLSNDSSSQNSDASELNTQQNNFRIQAVDFNLLKKSNKIRSKKSKIPTIT